MKCYICCKPIKPYDTMVRVREQGYPFEDEPRYLHMACFIRHAENWVFP